MLAETLCLVLLSMGIPRADYACQHLETVVEASNHYDISPEIMLALIYTESRWNHKAVSKSNACGLTQVLPKYTRNPKLTCKSLFDPKVSIWTGAKKLNYWIYKYGRGNKRTGLCGYNAGFRCKGKNKHKRGMYYAKKVLQRARKISRVYKKIHKIREVEAVK
tara:strand:- start:1817 stop:2305 length:489 start_codon:yes stop_codon:yes gene_type:complete